MKPHKKDARNEIERQRTERQRPNSARKDHRRWCKGKAGIEHQPECKKYNDLKRGIGVRGCGTQSWRLLVCKACGKELEIHYGSNKRKPAWVIN